MRGFAAQVRLLLVEHLRIPAYLVATMGFPNLFFLIFAAPEAKTAELANFLMASFLGFSVIGVMFLQFAHGLAEERSHAWYTYLRTLPIGAANFFFARILVAAVMSVLTAAVMTAVAVWTTPVSLPASRWLELYLHLALGGVCFAIMGVALGVWVTEKVALPLGNMIYLPLTYAGGLWKPPELLPDAVAKISKYLPTRSYGELLWDAVAGRAVNWDHYLQLLAWCVVFLIVAVLGARKPQITAKA